MRGHSHFFNVALKIVLCLVALPVAAQTTPMSPESLTIGSGNPPPPPPPPPVPLPPPAPPGDLADIAAGMSSGEWVTLTTNGFANGAILLSPENGSILEFTDEAVWDPNQNKLYILGTARGNGGYGPINQKWVEYSESTNTWSDLTSTLPPGFYIGHHAYNHMAFDASRGHYYVRFDNIKDPLNVWRYDTAADTWNQMPDMPSNFNTFGAIEFFPERDLLVFTDTSFGGRFLSFDPDSNSWSIDQLGGLDKTDHNFSRHDPVNGLLYFGGGHTAGNVFYKLERNGTATRLAIPPVPLGIDGSCTIHTVDPNGGMFLLLETDNVIYEYDPATDSWGTRGTHPLSDEGRLMSVAAVIQEYGVIIAVSYRPAGDTNGVFLYKP